MASASEFVNPSMPAKPEFERPPSYLGILNLLIQAFCVFLLLNVAFLRPTPLKIALSSTLCLALAAVGYHNLRRTFFLSRMPVRLKQDDPRVRHLGRFQPLIILALVAICAGSIYFLFFGGLRGSTHQWQWFYPVVVVFNGCSEYVQDRLPLRPPRIQGSAKIWDSIKPIHSDHWGERGAS